MDVVGKQRIEALSDGIYAIALTLLVLDLKVPVLPTQASDMALRAALAQLLPRALAWLLSFWVMGILWIGQVRTLRLVHSVSWPMLRVQLLVLACVSLMPFSTALLSEHGQQPTAAVVYSANLLAIALFGMLHTRLLVRDPRLHARALPATVLLVLERRSAIMLGSTAASLALAFFVPRWNLAPMLLLLLRPGVELPDRDAADDHGAHGPQASSTSTT